MYLVQKIENIYKFPLFLVEKKILNIKKIVCGYNKKKEKTYLVKCVPNDKMVIAFLACTFSPHFFLKFRGNEVCGPKWKITHPIFLLSSTKLWKALIIFPPHFLSTFFIIPFHPNQTQCKALICDLIYRCFVSIVLSQNFRRKCLNLGLSWQILMLQGL